MSLNSFCIFLLAIGLILVGVVNLIQSDEISKLEEDMKTINICK